MADWDGSFATMPRIRKLFGPLVPDLANIPEARWEEVLLPLSERDRREAAYNPALGARLHDAIALVERMPPGFSHTVARETIAEGTHVPAPATPARPSRASRQVNCRLSPAQYARLEEAARLLGDKPSVLARLLVTNGVNRIFADQARLALGKEEETA